MGSYQPTVLRQAFLTAKEALTIAIKGSNVANSALSNGSGTFSAGSLSVTNNISAGSLAVTGNITATAFSGYGSGFSNATLLTTVGASTWTIPAGAKRFKVTLVGAGGGGGGTSAAISQLGNGGGSGAVAMKFYDVVSGAGTLTFSIGERGANGGTGSAGSAGSSTNCVYNSVYVFANSGGGGSAGPTADGGGTAGLASGGDINLNGDVGGTGGQVIANSHILGTGASPPLGWGRGAMTPGASGGAVGRDGNGFGSGGGGGKTGTAATARGGGFGANGAIMIEW